MWIVRIALSRPYTFVVLALFLFLAAPVMMLRTPVDIFPAINVPVVSIIWTFTGLAPAEMETRITSIYERALTTTVDNIEHMESQSLNGVSIIKVYLQPQANVDGAIAEVIAEAQSTVKLLPPGITPPLVIRYDASTVPIPQLGLSGKGLSEQQLNSAFRNQATRPHCKSRTQSTLAASTQASAAEPVSVLHPQTGDLSDELVLPATLQAVSDAPIFARTGGYVAHWYADIGQHVSNGQVLAQIDSPDVDQELIRARATLNQSQANLTLAGVTTQRYQDWIKSNSVAQQEVDQNNQNLTSILELTLSVPSSPRFQGPPYQSRMTVRSGRSWSILIPNSLRRRAFPLPMR